MVLIFWLSVFIHDNYYLNCCSKTNRRFVKLSCYQKIWTEQFSTAVLKNLWKLMNIRKRFKIIPLLSCFIAATEIQLSPYHNIYVNVLEKSTFLLINFVQLGRRMSFARPRSLVKVMLRIDSQRRFLAQHSVATLLRHCFQTTLFQHCNNVLR